MKFELNRILSISVAPLLLLLIIFLSIYVRFSTLSSPVILDYDPWWYYRHAVEILNNNFQTPQWDLLSFYPPGRPAEAYQGLEYLMIFFYQAISIFKNISFMEVAKLTPLILVGLVSIPAFLIGKLLSNKWGGLTTALFVTLTPTFISVSMAGYCDSDAAVVLFFPLSIYSIFLALRKRNFYFYALAILVNLAFAYTWGGGWLPQIFYIFSLPGFVIFRILENMIHERKFKFEFSKIFDEVKPLVKPLVIILLITNVIGTFLGLGNSISSLLIGFGFTGLAGTVVLLVFTTVIALFGFVAGYSFRGVLGGVLGTIVGLALVVFYIFFGGLSFQPLLVNISVAELQRINIFSTEGFYAIASRIGMATTLFTLIGLPLLVFFKIYKKVKINFEEIFMFILALVTFYLILSGVRFALLFSIAAAISTGYVIGNLFAYVKKDVLVATLFGIILLSMMMFVSDAIQTGYASAGMEIDQNWIAALDWLKTNSNKDTLVATWWDPGHIITGYTGLKVMADGAHCPSGVCIPYNHDIRIQDMGRIFSTNNEAEAINILKKYTFLTPEQCQEARNKYDGIMPANACDPIKKVYVIASNDLIGKYYWLSYFGSGGTGKNYVTCSYSQEATQSIGALTYSCAAGFQMEISIVQTNQTIFFVMNAPQIGVRNMIIKDAIFTQQGQVVALRQTNATNVIDGLFFIDSSFQSGLFMESSIRDSLFTNMFFFNGQGSSDLDIPKLQNFTLVYTNPEIRIYEVKS